MKRYLLSETGNFYKANLHAHTTISDGRFTPEEVKAAFADAGYSILALTDHEIFIPHNDLSDENFLFINAIEVSVNEFPRPTRFEKTYHLNFYAKDRNTTLCPVFAESRVVRESTRAFVTDEMKKTDAWAYYSPSSINDLIRKGNENGFFCTYNHPVWSLQNYPDYIDLKDLWGIEVYNHSCFVEDYIEKSGPLDDLLKVGQNVYPVCTDDNHDTFDRFGGWVMVKADKLDYDSVVSSLLSGNFYASTGPEIRELWIEDGVLYVRTDEISDILTVTDWRVKGTKRFLPKPDGDGYLTEIPITRYVDKYRYATEPGWRDSYIRLEVNGADGKCAFTRAYHISEFPELL